MQRNIQQSDSKQNNTPNTIRITKFNSSSLAFYIELRNIWYLCHSPSFTKAYWNLPDLAYSLRFLALFVIIEKDQGACTNIQHIIEFFFIIIKDRPNNEPFQLFRTNSCVWNKNKYYILFQANKETKTHARIPRHKIDKTTQRSKRMATHISMAWMPMQRWHLFSKRKADKI